MLKRLTIAILALAAIPLGMQYTYWLRDHMLTIPYIEKPGVHRGEVINWPYNLKNLTQLFGGEWSINPFCANHSNNRYDLWATLFCMVICGVAVQRLGGWFRVKMGLWMVVFWFTIWYASVVTELRGFYILTPIVLMCFYRSEQNER